MSTRAELLRRIVHLGAVMRDRGAGFESTLRRLRAYYVVLHHGLGERGHRVDVQWAPDMVTRWEQALRIDTSIPVRPRNSQCTCPHPQVFTAHVFPGGIRSQCAACGSGWIELHESAS